VHQPNCHREWAVSRIEAFGLGGPALLVSQSYSILPLTVKVGDFLVSFRPSRLLSGGVVGACCRAERTVWPDPASFVLSWLCPSVSSRLVSFKPVPLPAIQPSRPAVSSHVPPPRNTPLQPEFHTQGRLHLGKDGKTVDEAYICLSSGLGMCIIAWEAGVDGTWRNPLNMK
jgi:hypothetical protein